MWLKLLMIFVVMPLSMVTSAFSTAGAHDKADADAISGEWEAILSGQGGSIEVDLKLKLKLENDNVTGTVESSHLGNGTISEGSWTNNRLRLIVETGRATLTLTGTLQKDKLVGAWDAGHMQGEWKAKRQKHQTRSH